MKQAIRNIFCVLTICSMIAFVGCGDKKKEGAAADDKGGAAASTDDGKGSDKKD